MTSEKIQTRRIGTLDGIRGAGMMVVLVNHCFLSWHLVEKHSLRLKVRWS